MSTQKVLPLLDLSNVSLNKRELQLAVRKWGAFRLSAPEVFRAFTRSAPYIRDFFSRKVEEKYLIGGYSQFGSECIRGGSKIPKESLYFNRKCDQDRPSAELPTELVESITGLFQAWSQLRGPVFKALSSEIFDTIKPLTGEPSLDYETLGLHYYASDRLEAGEFDYNPPHKDGGTLTILIRGVSENDGLEVADLESTTKVKSTSVGREASFLPVPAATDEVVVFLGTRMQRILGEDSARACVHRVRASMQNEVCLAKERHSVAIFCAPPAYP